MSAPIRNWMRLAAGVCMAATAWSQTIISTVVGTEWIFPGDRKPAVDAPLGPVTSVAVDPAGNVLVADQSNNMVFRVNTATGVIRVVAGNGLPRFSGDGGPATDAALNLPSGVAVDSDGNVYIADTGNRRIRKVTPSGIITTLVGEGGATTAGLTYPAGVTVDAQKNIYIADVDLSRAGTFIRKVSLDGAIATIAGGGTSLQDNIQAANSRLGVVQGLAIDGTGNLFLADFSGNLVRRIAPNGIITTVAGNGALSFSPDGTPAASSSLRSPGGLAVGRDGTLYISETNSLLVRRIANGVLTTVAGSRRAGLDGDGGPATSAKFRSPFGLALDAAGNLYIADRDNFRIRKVSDGIISTIAGNGGFEFTPEGAAAANAYLAKPFGISLDSAGNLYIGDTANNRIRRVSKEGGLFTVAGNGAREFSGDGGQATQAGLATPIAAVADRAGNIYISDSDNNAIRRVAPNGIICTFAGVQSAMVPCNAGAQATATSLATPYGLLLDGSGNLLVSELFGNRVLRITPNGSVTIVVPAGQVAFPGDLGMDRAGNIYVSGYDGTIRRVAPNGTIQIIAGGGTLRGAAADGRPATQAALTTVGGLFVDSAGNVYFTEAGLNLVRKISTSGVLTTLAGNGFAGFSGDGGPAIAATLINPVGILMDGAGNLLFADSDNNRIRVILLAPAAAPTFDVNPTTLSYSAKSNGSLSDGLAISLSPSLVGMRYEVKAGADWIALDSTSGVMPATIQVKADPTKLPAGDIEGTITITSAGANPPTRTIKARFHLDGEAPSKLSIDAKDLTFSFVKDAGSSQRQFAVSNAGGGTLNFSISAATDRGGPWLSAAADSGNATPKQPFTVTITGDPAGLDAGTYTGAITVTPEGRTAVTLPVSMTIAEIKPKIVLSQSGLKFNGASGGGAPLPQSIAILNSGTGTLKYSVKLSTLSGGPDWLQTASDGGSVDPDQTGGPPLAVKVTPGGLGPGEYYGRIRIEDPAAINSPQIITVVLTVEPEGATPLPEVSPTGLVFTGLMGNSPGSQTVQIANLTSSPITYSSTRATDDGSNWFVVAPVSGTIAPNEYGRILVQPDFTTLAAGPRRGTVTLRFSDGSARTIDVLGVISDGSAGAPSASKDERSAPGNCSASILPQFVNPEAEFRAVLAQPLSLAVRVVDGCGNPIAGSSGTTMVVSFSNGDDNVPMTYIGSADWRQSWTPRSLVARVDMTVTVISTAGAYRIGQARRSGMMLTSMITAPIVERGAVQNAATLRDSTIVAPGGLITIRGKGLAASDQRFEGLPLVCPGAIDTEVLLQGQCLPLLFASDGQVNAQVPYALDVNAEQQLLVRRKETLSQPAVLTVAPAQPGILTTSQTGSGQGFIYRVGADGSLTLADSGAPAAAGDRISIFCAGLGKVTPEVGPGVQPPGSPRSRVISPVSLTIGGIPAQFVEATLRPDADLPGRYEVIAIVPPGVDPGSGAPVILTVAGQVSPPATMALK